MRKSQPQPQRGETWQGANTVTVLRVDSYGNVIFTCLDPSGKLRRFAQPLRGFVRYYVKVLGIQPKQ